MENHSYRDIIGDPAAPFLSSLAGTGASFTDSRGITHPSEPNYLGLFSGSTQGVTDDSCLPRLGADNLGHQLLAAGYTFVGYSEDLPRPGYRGCQNGLYATKHNPWVNFANLPDQVNQPMSAFPTDPNRLPTVSFVVPNVDNDMHDGSVGQGDTWLRTHLGQYAGWATAHRSLLLVTWDENDGSSGNDIPTIAVGSGVHGGRQADPITHYRVLRTLENAFGLNPLGAAGATSGIAALGG
ncbi:MAG: alkaline phosphatase family protein [Actinomycetota bacterium]|nr:alkaline phosphatase family protein [Actinomycetota bacterium]